MSKRIPQGPDALQARERLVEAAVDIFGQHGYDLATTRMIAGAAEVNIAAIPYYFTGKEGLYLAAVGHILEGIEERLAPILRELGERSGQGPLTAQLAQQFLERILEALVLYMIGSPEGTRFARVILREHLFPSSAYELIFARLMEPMVRGLGRLIGLICGEASERLQVLRAVAIVGQVLVFRVAREAMVRGLGMEGYSREETMEIRDIILAHTRRALDRDKPKTGEDV